MATFVRLDPKRATLGPDVRVLAPEDYASFAASDTLLTDARARAEAILAEAETQAQEIAAQAEALYASEKLRGFEEGQAEASAEISERMITMVTRSVDYLASAEGQIARVVILCLRKILDDAPEEDKVIAAARNALSVVRNEARVTLVVRPDIRDAVADRIGELLSGYGDIGFLDVAADAGLAEGGCRLETDLGVVDASIEQQITALENAMKARLQAT